MYQLDQNLLDTINGGVMHVFGRNVIVPNTTNIPATKFIALEYGFEQLFNDVWDDKKLMVYLCSTNSLPYYEQFLNDFLFRPTFV
ncbi:hypothetical protein [Candidatus Berkiella aquae]|uniref:Uncharacterized protein n=1 Tax=Candidatus Berkiella aquae TaxID=295108 RepID=A0A0Q9YSY4_9GAMM|nr:hypothetical protein [Candidatus Berkiella aquae]MCS5711311.1 hypothetical protein [Candidatus Berkiella aquae]